MMAFLHAPIPPFGATLPSSLLPGTFPQWTDPLCIRRSTLFSTKRPEKHGHFSSGCRARLESKALPVSAFPMRVLSLFVCQQIFFSGQYFPLFFPRVRGGPFPARPCGLGTFFSLFSKPSPFPRNSFFLFRVVLTYLDRLPPSNLSFLPLLRHSRFSRFT